MPILQQDPWRKQYFEIAPCPEDVFIPLKDTDAYQLNPLHNWAYNKLMVAEKQLIPSGPHGTIINSYPAFSKPIYNLRSMGAGIEVLFNDEQYKNSLKPGYMWSQLLTGKHYSTDVAVVNGRVVWLSHVEGFPLESGMFDYWELKENSELSHYLIPFIQQHFSNYNGMLNLETIGGKIIEIHLRFADQWPDLYGKWFVQSLVDLYTNKNFPIGSENRNGYSVVLFGSSRYYQKPKKNYIDQLLKVDGISSIQFPFHEGVSPDFHSMPPGGFRIAIINGSVLEVCKNVREQIKITMNVR